MVSSKSRVHVADGHAVQHLGDRPLVVLADDLERRVPIFGALRRQLSRDSGHLGCHAFRARRVAVGAPRRSLNAAVRGDVGASASSCARASVPFAGVGGTHDATVCTIFSSSASTASGAAIERQLAPRPQWNQTVAKKAIAELWLNGISEDLVNGQVEQRVAETYGCSADGRK